MDRLTSRKNPVIRQLRALGRERSARAEAGLFVGDGEKLFQNMRTDASVGDNLPPFHNR